MWKQDLGGIPLAKILLEMKNITKTFPGVKALDNVNLQVEEGEIHALVGDERYLSVWVLRRGHHL